jgi:hypothetical protein
MSPRLRPLATFQLVAAEVLEIGAVPAGRRRIIRVDGGHFDGDRFSGEVLPGGGDWQLVAADGSAAIDARHTLRTHDGALVHMSASGVRHGPPSAIQKLAAGEEVDPAEYYFRMTCRFETGAPAYRWLNHILAVTAGARLPRGVRYDVFELT